MSNMIKKHLMVLSLLFFSILAVNQCYAVSVGDSYGGGTVFCVSNTSDITQCKTEGSGDYGLIMANEDQVNYDSNSKHGVRWSSEYKEIGSSAQSLDNGATNTEAIIKAHPNDNSSNNAAWLCHNYKDKIEGHTDWYLPSKNELNKMYLYAKANSLIGKNCSGSKVNGVQCLIGGYSNPQYKIYWSSSEYSGYGYLYSGKISAPFAARAVRAFNNLTIQPFNNSDLDQNQIKENDNDNELKKKKEQKKLKEKDNKQSTKKQKSVFVGDSYGGGTVFCVYPQNKDSKDIADCVTDKDASGTRGLVMANEDQVNYDSNSSHGVSWSSEYKEIGSSAQSLDNGATNTEAIIKAHPNDNSSNNAAWLCRSYKDKIEGHTDWYLPSKNELNKMYLYAKANNLIGKSCSGSKVNGVQCLVGGDSDPQYKIYWSSSESSGYYDDAWFQDFSDGSQDGDDKFYDTFAVRAVRAFN